MNRNEKSARKRPWRRVAAMVLGLVFAALLGEAVMRWAFPAADPTAPKIGTLYFRDAKGSEVDPRLAIEAGIVVPVSPSPRPRMGFAPGARFAICYRDFTAPWLDAQGCVDVSMSSMGIREREEIGPDKPVGEKRVLCLGDSFTFGWGIPVEAVWVRRMEPLLQEFAPTDGRVRTVNCGAAGTTVVDEYQWGLEHRFAALQPDFVLVTLCLNDLVMTNGGLGHFKERRPSTGSALLDRVRGMLAGDPRVLAEDAELVERLLALPADHPWYQANVEVDRSMHWASGTPQSGLRAMRDWCKDREIPFAVCIWPFLQGLGPDAWYPFAGIHERVAEFCGQESIPCLDLLPTLAQTPASTLWVSPQDMHANPIAQELAAPKIAAFVRTVWGGS